MNMFVILEKIKACLDITRIFFFLLLQLLNELSKLFAELFKKNIDKICTFYAQSYI